MQSVSKSIGFVVKFQPSLSLSQRQHGAHVPPPSHTSNTALVFNTWSRAGATPSKPERQADRTPPPLLHRPGERGDADVGDRPLEPSWLHSRFDFPGSKLFRAKLHFWRNFTPVGALTSAAMACLFWFKGPTRGQNGFLDRKKKYLQCILTGYRKLAKLANLACLACEKVIGGQLHFRDHFRGGLPRFGI